MKKFTFIGTLIAAIFFSATVSFGQPINEDFEAYTVGGKLAQQAQGMGRQYWTTWSGTVGGSEDSNVSNAQAHAGTKTVNVLPDNDLILKLGAQTGGAFKLEFFIYVPTEKSGYFNLLHKFAGSGSEHAVEIYFNVDGTGKFVSDNVETPFNHQKSAWIPVTFDLDLNMDQAHVEIGTFTKDWQWSLKAGGGEGLNELGAADFFGHEAACSYFVDDIKFTQTDEAALPNIAVTPTSITENLDINTTQDVPVNVSNTGEGIAKYSTYVEYTLPAFAEGPEFELTKIPDLSLFTGDGGIGHTSTTGMTDEIAQKFTPDFYKDKNGAVIRKIRYYILNDNGSDLFAPGSDLTFRIYGQGRYSNEPGEVLSEQVLLMSNFIYDDWNEVELDDPIRLTGGDYWVTVEMLERPNSHPLTHDPGPTQPGGDWIRTNGGSWSELHVQSPTLNYNWAIVAICDGETYSSWATLPDAYGSIAGGASTNIPLTLSAKSVLNGEYKGSVIFNSNDEAHPTFTIPVTMTVGGSVVCDTVENFKIEMKPNLNCQLTVSWKAIPDGEFNVYKDGTLVAENITTAYYRVNLGFTEVSEWCVEQVCNGGVSDKICGSNEVCKVGIDEVDKAVKIYPNPAATIVNITGTDIARVEVYNAIGQQVEEKTGRITTIDVAHYNTGIYFFRVFDSNSNVVTKRIMVAR